MSCESVQKLMPLYYYGELPPEEEDRLEAHVFECAACEREMGRQRALAAALDRRAQAPPPMLLDDCRADLMAAIAGGAPELAKSASGRNPASQWGMLWRQFLDAMTSTMAGMGRLRQPLGAAALLAVGFLVARVTLPGPQVASLPSKPSSDEMFSTVRSVQPDNAGGVQIALDETRRRVVSGRMDDQNIQKLLLAAAREQNPAVRVESVDLLKDRAGSGEVREALLNALEHDGNPGVRLKALEGLKPLSGDPGVRKTLAQVLLADDNAAIRMQAVDMLVSQRDDAVVGVLQNMIQREDNGYVRLKVEKALKEMNASIGTF
jgi:hypothetical protein